MKKAFITGITGQDGSYLAELLLDKGYEVHGLVRRCSSSNTKRIDHLLENPETGNKALFVHYGDMTDSSNLIRLIEKIQPAEIYNLAAQSDVQVSFEMPEFTAESAGVGTLRILDAIKESGIKARFYQASTSELFGGIPETVPQNETTTFYPRSPYAAAKLYAYWITVNYREAHGMYTCNGILFNHESPRRGKTFVTRKITAGIADILNKKQDKIALGNLDAKRDWGFAGDYVEAMWLMLQQENPEDYVIATGETHSVREFCELAFKSVGTHLEWSGEGIDEKGIDSATGRELICIDSRYFRPTEVDLLLGDPSKAKQKLGWVPKTSFPELVKMMVDAELQDYHRRQK